MSVPIPICDVGRFQSVYIITQTKAECSLSPLSVSDFILSSVEPKLKIIIF